MQFHAAAITSPTGVSTKKSKSIATTDGFLLWPTHFWRLLLARMMVVTSVVPRVVVVVVVVGIYTYTTTTTTTPPNISPNIPSTNVPSLSLSLGDGGAVVVRRMTFHHHHHKMSTHSIHPLSSGRLYRTHPPTAAAVITTTTDGPSLSAFGETSQNIHTSHHILQREREATWYNTSHTHPQSPTSPARWSLGAPPDRSKAWSFHQKATNNNNCFEENQPPTTMTPHNNAIPNTNNIYSRCASCSRSDLIVESILYYIDRYMYIYKYSMYLVH